MDNEKFQEKYNEKVLPSLKELEKERKNKYITYSLTAIMLIFVSIFHCCLFYKFYVADFSNFYESIPLVVILPIFLMWTFFFMYRKWHYAIFLRKLKSVSEEKAAACFENIKAAENDAIPNNELENSKLFSPFNLRMANDNYLGEYEGINFKISNSSLWANKTTPGKIEYISKEYQKPISSPSFSGIIILYDLCKKSEDKTIIKSKDIFGMLKRSFNLSALVGIIMFTLILLMDLIDPFKKLDMAGVVTYVAYLPVLILLLTLSLFVVLRAFNDDDINDASIEKVSIDNSKFKVESNNSNAAKSIMTTSFIEKLNNLENAFKTQKMKCAFYEDKFIVSLETEKGLFELGSLNKSLTKKETMDELYNKIEAIYSLSEELK